MKKIIIVLILILTICGCSNKKQEQLEQIMKEQEYIIIDVRTKEEYDASHIENAINIPYDTISENTKLDKDKVILVYCKSGTRSKIAYTKLTNLGYTTYDLGAFQEIDLPIE